MFNFLFKTTPKLSDKERLSIECNNELNLMMQENERKVRENRQASILFRTPDETGATPEAYWINFVLSNRNKPKKPV